MTQAQMQTVAPSIRYFPIAFFAVVMGLWGWTLASQAAVAAGVLPASFAGIIRWLAIVGSVLIFGTYFVKLLRHPRACLDEWHSPPKLAFFPAVSISLLLIGTAYLRDLPDFARSIWLVGVTAQGVLTLAVISSWISHRPFQIGHLSPAWFIPAVGNVIVPLAGAPLGYVELSWLFFSGGLVFWLVLLTLVMNRLMFHDPLPERLLPTLVILIAPPALAFLSYTALAGQVDAFGRILLNAAYVFALLVLIQAPKFPRLPFALTWWALSFPVAGLVVASFTFAAETGLVIYAHIGALILGALSLIIPGLLVKTGLVLSKGHFFRPEG